MIRISAFLLFTAAVFSLFWVADQQGLFSVHRLNVELAQDEEGAALSSQRQSSVSQRLDGLRSQKIWQVSPAQVVAALAPLSWIADLSVSRRLPDQVDVVVRPKKIALIYDSGTELRPVASDGTLLERVSIETLPDLALLRGEIFKAREDLRRQAVQLIQALPPKGSFVASLVSEITYKEHEGFGLFLRSPAVKVELGLKEFKKKAARVDQVLTYLTTHGIEGRIVDASYHRKVVVQIKEAKNQIK